MGGVVRGKDPSIYTGLRAEKVHQLTNTQPHCPIHTHLHRWLPSHPNQQECFSAPAATDSSELLIKNTLSKDIAI